MVGPFAHAFSGTPRRVFYAPHSARTKSTFRVTESAPAPLTCTSFPSSLSFLRASSSSKLRPRAVLHHSIHPNDQPFTQTLRCASIPYQIMLSVCQPADLIAILSPLKEQEKPKLTMYLAGEIEIVRPARRGNMMKRAQCIPSVSVLPVSATPTLPASTTGGSGTQRTEAASSGARAHLANPSVNINVAWLAVCVLLGVALPVT